MHREVSGPRDDPAELHRAGRQPPNVPPPIMRETRLQHRCPCEYRVFSAALSRTTGSRQRTGQRLRDGPETMFCPTDTPRHARRCEDVQRARARSSGHCWPHQAKPAVGHSPPMPDTPGAPCRQNTEKTLKVRGEWYPHTSKPQEMLGSGTSCGKTSGCHQGERVSNALSPASTQPQPTERSRPPTSSVIGALSCRLSARLQGRNVGAARSRHSTRHEAGIGKNGPSLPTRQKRRQRRRDRCRFDEPGGEPPLCAARLPFHIPDGFRKSTPGKVISAAA